MTYGSLMASPELSDSHMAGLAQVKKMWTSSAPRGPVITESAFPWELMGNADSWAPSSSAQSVSLGVESQDCMF